MKRKRKTFRIKCFQTRSDIEHVKLILGLAGFFSVLVSHIRRERGFTQDNLPGHCRPAQKDKQLFALTLATPDNWEWPVTGNLRRNHADTGRACKRHTKKEKSNPRPCRCHATVLTTAAVSPMSPLFYSTNTFCTLFTAQQLQW